MALTDAQMTDTRRFMGYQNLGTTMTANVNQDLVYVQFGMMTMSLYQRLTTLSASEEAVLINTYLTPLASLESGIYGAADNLDTAQAAVWVRNANEVRDREKLFDSWRRRLCAFLGAPPGPGIGNGITQIVRC